METNSAALGLFRSRKEINRAVSALVLNGFTLNAISVLVPNREGTKDFVYKQRTKLKTFGLYGAAIGLIIGGTIGLMIGTEVFGSGVFGSFTQTARNLIGILIAGLGILFGTAGGVFVGIGVPENTDQRFQGYTNQGGTVVSVRVKNSVKLERAQKILAQFGGQDVSTSGNEDKTLDTAATPRT